MGGDGPHGAPVLPSGYAQVHHPLAAANTARQERSRNNREAFANWVCAELHALADEEVGFRGHSCHCSAAGVMLPTLAGLHT